MRKINLILGFCLLSLVVSAKRVGVYCFFADNGAHLYEDENVKLAVGMSDANVLSVIIVNKTENVLFIDKANSFLYLNGATNSYFTNAAYTTGKTTDTGAAVNLGGVANSMGLGGGFLGGLLGGTTIGGGTTTTNTTTVYEQRVIGIAPRSAQALTNLRISSNLASNFLDKGSYGLGGKLGAFIDPYTKTSDKFKVGKSRTYTEGASPLSVKASIKYCLKESFDEELTSTATASNFIENIVVDNKKGLKKTDANLPYCLPFQGKSRYAFGSGGVSAWAVVGVSVASLAVITATTYVLISDEANKTSSKKK